MDERLAKSLVDQAASLGFTRMTLIGGEPLLYPGLVQELLEHAKAVGMPERGIVTNGFWGAWPEERIANTAEVLTGLLTHATFCFDAFHAEHIEANAFWRAVRSFDAKPTEVRIRVADVYGDKGAGTFLASQGSEALNRSYLVYPLQPVGRAASLPADCFIAYPDARKPTDGRTKALCVTWDGNAYPCDHPGIARTTELLANAAESSLADILKQVEVGRHPWT